MAGSRSCILELKSNGNPAGRGSRSVILSAAVAAARSPAGTSSGRGNSPLRIISTMRVPAFDEILDGIDERHMENVHRQIDGASAALLGARVVPFIRSRRDDLKLAACRTHVPTAASRN